MAKAAQAVEDKPDQQEETPATDGKKQAQTVEFSEAAESEPIGAGGSIDILLDMSVPVTITIGQTEMSVQRLLQLGPGSVITLDKSIDEPADLYIKDSKFATGNIVVVDGRFAIKIEQILGLGDSAPKTAQA
jgi:flagellar motor switch protein FliN/FliY